MLIVRNLSKSFGPVCAVNNVNFCLKKGEVVALLGPNGAGKTTLMRLMTGFYEPDCGAVELNGYDVNRKRQEALSRVAYVPESGALYPEMTVYEYLRFMAGLRRISHQDFGGQFGILVQAAGVGRSHQPKMRNSFQRIQTPRRHSRSAAAPSQNTHFGRTDRRP